MQLTTKNIKENQYSFEIKMEHLYKKVDERNFYCSQHLMQFATVTDYEYHKKKYCIEMLSHPMKCYFEKRGVACGHQSESIVEVILHMRDVHRRIICEECGMLFISLGQMEQHIHKNYGILKSM